MFSNFPIFPYFTLSQLTGILKETEFPYTLDPSSRKFHCPHCGKKRFVRYIDTQTRAYVSNHYGRCDREVNCAYHKSPYEEYKAKAHVSTSRKGKFGKSSPVSSEQLSGNKEANPIFIKNRFLQKSLNRAHPNYFIQYLCRIFDYSTVNQLIRKYYLGTSKKIYGGCIFYQIDVAGNIRRGKIIQYDPKTGHKNKINSVHYLWGYKDYKPSICYFGSHLVTKSVKPIALVESEKTAIISSAYFPEFIWLATGSKSTLKVEYAEPFFGRSVVLFPDIGAYEDWQKRAEHLSQYCNVYVSNFLENSAGSIGRDRGYDLADYLVRFKVEDIRGNDKSGDSQKGEGKYPADWDSIYLDPTTVEYNEACRISKSECDTEEEGRNLSC